MPAPTTPPAPPDHGGVIGKRAERASWLARLNAWRKHSPLNPYWIENRWLRRAGVQLSQHASGWMLDIGVAEKPYGELFAPHVERYIGLEYPPVADNLNPDIWDRLPTIVHIVQVFGDARRLPFGDGTFDTVASFEVLEHIDSPEQVMSEMARVTKPGGRVLLTVPFAAPHHQMPFDHWRFTRPGLEGLLARHGLVVELLESRGNFASTTGATVSHFLLRTFGTAHFHHDGSASLSRWRAPLVLPFIALVQLVAVALERVTNDDAFPLGWIVVARKKA
jgi:SAM-dependent methyltransferase